MDTLHSGLTSSVHGLTAISSLFAKLIYSLTVISNRKPRAPFASGFAAETRNTQKLMNTQRFDLQIFKYMLSLIRNTTAKLLLVYNLKNLICAQIATAELQLSKTITCRSSVSGVFLSVVPTPTTAFLHSPPSHSPPPSVTDKPLTAKTLVVVRAQTTAESPIVADMLPVYEIPPIAVISLVTK